MPSKSPRPGPEDEPRSASGARVPRTSAAALSEAARTWTGLVDGWWRRQAAVLPPELERAMRATLDQSKALVNMAFAQSARALGERPEGAIPAPDSPGGDSAAAGEFGLWQPVIDACRACESRLLGDAGDDAPSESGPARDYRRAANAYLNEFMQINAEVAQRLQKKLAADPPPDFRRLHALVVEETENAYLERVSTDRFAALQAAFINAMFRLRREMTGGGAPGKA